MLAALLLMCLLPLAAIPFLGDEADADDDTGEGADPSALGAAQMGTSAPVEAVLGGALIQVTGQNGTQTVADFEPSIDILEIDLSAETAAFSYEGKAGAGGATAAFQFADGSTSSVFLEGLAEVPTDDIMLRFSGEAEGETVELSLTDALASAGAAAAPGPMGDPVTPDPAGPEPLESVDLFENGSGPEGGPQLGASLESDSENTVGIGAALADAFDFGFSDTDLTYGDDIATQAEGSGATTGISLSETAPAIRPDAPIEVIDGGAGEGAITTDSHAAYALGGAGDDTPVFHRQDEAAGGAGADTFWLYQDGAAGPSVADVTDFQVGEDVLRVSLNPQVGLHGAPEVEVRASANGEDGEVIVNGDLVAILRGAPGATTSDVFVSVEPDVFPMANAPTRAAA